MFGVINDPNSLDSLGIPGLVFVIFILSGVVVFLYKRIDTLQTRIDSLQEQRIVDARETRDRITEPLENQTKLSEKTYDLLLQFIQRGK